jgi:hypothetical protein
VDAEATQGARSDRIGAEYEAHCDDPTSREYRARFIEQPLLVGIDLAGREVLEAMCVSGMTSSGLLARGGHVTGLDISEECIAAFRRRWPHCRALCASITDTPLPAAGGIASVHARHRGARRGRRTRGAARRPAAHATIPGCRLTCRRGAM